MPNPTALCRRSRRGRLPWPALIAVWAILQLGAGIAPSPRLDASVAPVRGIFRFSSTSWTAMAADGFNWVTDGGTTTNNYAGQRAAGLAGMVYLNAYNNSSCHQTMTDAQMTQVVRSNATGGNSGAVYQVGDEPTTNGCNANPTYTHMTAVIHAADPASRTWVADDQFNDPSTSHWPAGLPMKGSVDILAFDIYPCQSGPCRLDMIDLAVQRIHSVGLRNWEFILQDFGPCQSWRAPTALEVTQQFQHWRGAGALGYWVYAYDTDPTPCAGNVTGSGELRQINGLSVNPAPAPAPKPTAPPQATSSPVTSSPTPGSPPPATPAGIPTPSPTRGADASPAAQAVRAATVVPLLLIGAGLLLALTVVALSYWPRRTR